MDDGALCNSIKIKAPALWLPAITPGADMSDVSHPVEEARVSMTAVGARAFQFHGAPHPGQIWKVGKPTHACWRVVVSISRTESLLTTGSSPHVSPLHL